MTLDELVKDFSENTRSVVTKINLSKRSKNPHYYNEVINLIQSSYEKFDNNIFETLYCLAHDIKQRPKCNFCDNECLFYGSIKGYRKYCSAKCARKDASRIPEASRKIGTEKRNQKMKEMLSDPIKGKEYREKISKASKNQSKEVRRKQSERMKKKILEGEFTPKITNSWTRWNSEVDGKKFRSSFDALFFIYKNLYRNDDVLYEKLRIGYNFENKNHVYIVDFIDSKEKIAYEIKPESLEETQKIKQNFQL